MVARQKFSLSRREMLTTCATIGTLAVTSSSLGGLPDNGSSQAQRPDSNVTADLVSKALEQTMDQFQAVREFEIDTLIDPSVIFQAAPDDVC